MVTERMDIDGEGGVNVTGEYVGPSAMWIANLLPHRVGFDRGWFWTSTAICHGGESDGLAFRQRPACPVLRYGGNGIDVRCHTRGCSRDVVMTGLEARIGLPIRTAYEPLVRSVDKLWWLKEWPRQSLALYGTAALVFAAPLPFGLGLQTAIFSGMGFCIGAWLMIRSLAPRPARRLGR